MRVAKPPAIIFVCPSPTRVGAAEDEVRGVMIYWGFGTAPTSGLSSSSDPTPSDVFEGDFDEKGTFQIFSLIYFSFPR